MDTLPTPLISPHGYELLPCCGSHAYESGWNGEHGATECPCQTRGENKPTAYYENGDRSNWCWWQVMHLNPCRCGSDTVLIPAPCELKCENCGYGVNGNNYDLLTASWNKRNPPGKFHPYIDGSI